jgi:hypothetical protein
MPRTKAEVPTIVRWLRQSLVARDVYWSEQPVPLYGSVTLAYGWSDGIVTWTETR